MKLLIHPDTVKRLARELAQAGRREIGGVLVGEHLDRNTFRIADLSIQRQGGDTACFVRRPGDHKAFLDRFFSSTGDAYDRFNYLGEWHSHPSFSTEPSGTDLLQMHEIVNDGPSAPPFAVLMIVRLDADRRLALRAMAFRGDTVEEAALVVSDRPESDPARPRSWASRWFGRPATKPIIRFI
ncbi:Mov34/MPN/PAD-1 family protein [Brevundimonas sp.]|uniref:Mov34/MPN/PAD-1 family protein n=1 Tax=Brevundimonas sp. TaxID=1871086 RepID=UPI003F6E810F